VYKTKPRIVNESKYVIGKTLYHRWGKLCIETNSPQRTKSPQFMESPSGDFVLKRNHPRVQKVCPRKVYFEKGDKI